MNHFNLLVVGGLLLIAAALVFVPVPTENREGLFMIAGGLLAILKGNSEARKE
jgi:hypothetical protein